MVPLTLCTPISLISLVAGFVNTVSGAPQLATMAAQSPPAPVVSAAPASVQPHVAVRDFVQSVSLTSQPHFRGAVDGPRIPNVPLPPSSDPAESFDSAEVYAQEDALVALINRERAAQGLGELTQDPLLASVARAHSQDMCDRNYFDHRAPSPGPVTPMDRYLAAASDKPNYAMVGENIFYRSNTDSIGSYADEAHEAFMQSPGHRANILTPQYTQVGVGIYRNPVTGEFWVTEMFCTVDAPK